MEWYYWIIIYGLIGLIAGASYLFNYGQNSYVYDSEEGVFKFFIWFLFWPTGSFELIYNLGKKYNEYKKERIADKIQKIEAKKW